MGEQSGERPAPVVDAPAKPLSASAQRVQDALAAAGVATTVVEYPSSARTSQEAAGVLGCSVGEIAKSLVFRQGDDAAVLVIASGANRVDLAKVAAILGAVRRQGGRRFRTRGDRLRDRRHPAPRARAPVDHDRRSRPPGHDRVYAAGGTPNAMFAIRPAELVRVSGGRVADVALLTPS